MFEDYFSKKYKIFILSALFLFSVFLVFYNFTSSPRTWVDEGVFTETARNFANGKGFSLQTAPGEYYSMRSFLLSTGYPVILPVALSFKLFGISIVSARLPMLLYMLLFLFFSFLFVSKKYGFKTATITTLLLISFSPFYGNGRPVQGEVPGVFFLVLGAYLLSLLEESDWENKKYLLLTSILLGLSASVKPIFLLLNTVSIFLVVVLNYKLIKNKKNLVYFFVTYFSFVFIWIKIHFPYINSIYDVIREFLYFGGTHNSNQSIFLTVYNNLLKFFTESTPILLGVMLLVVFINFVILYKRKNIKLSQSEQLLILFVFLNFLGYLNGTGWYRYFFPANILVYLFFTKSLNDLSFYFNKPLLKKAVTLFPMFLIIFQFYHLFFIAQNSFSGNWDTNKQTSEFFSKIDKNKKIGFYNTMDVAVFWNGENYYNYTNLVFLVAGDENLIKNKDLDYLVVDKYAMDKIDNKCFNYYPVGKYYVYENKHICK